MKASLCLSLFALVYLAVPSTAIRQSEGLDSLAVEQEGNGDELQQDSTKYGQGGGSTCIQAVPNSVSRKCADQLTGCWSSKVCKCPEYSQMTGSNQVCNQGEEGRRFDPSALNGKGCSCKVPAYVPIADLFPHFNCAWEVQSLDEFVARAHEWCDSKFVPADKRVPEKMRGFYWFKGLGIQNFGFCPSLGEWDPKAKTLKMSPWTHFVYHKSPSKSFDGYQVAKMAYTDSHFDSGVRFGSGHLVYTMTFQNDDMKYADIVPNQALMAATSKYTLVELDETPDKKAKSKVPGDIYDRPCYMFGKYNATDFFHYYAIRIMYDDGTINNDNLALMKETEPSNPIVRYAQTC